MKRILSFAGACALAVVVAVPATAKTDPKKVAVRWARSYVGALAEAKERGCVIFATFHAEH
jgi:hypothetical protein